MVYLIKGKVFLGDTIRINRERMGLETVVTPKITEVSKPRRSYSISTLVSEKSNRRK